MIRVKADASGTLLVPTEKFLLEVEKRPCLWDPGHREYRNLATRRVAFRLIAKLLLGKNISEKKLDDIGTCLSRKWKLIRDYWIKVKSNPSNVKCADNQYFKILKFLEPTIASEILKQQTVKDSGASSGDSSRSTPIKTYSQTQSSVTLSQDEEDATSRLFMTKRKRTSGNSCESSVTASRECTKDAKLSPPSAPKQKLSEECRSTVVIDGVEFEQVTLENGEVVVKLKEEKLEDDPPHRRKEKRKKKRPAHKDEHSESGHRAQQGSQSVDHELAKTSKHVLLDGQPPEYQSSSIDGTVVIEGPTVEIPWSSNEGTPAKRMHVDLGSVQDLKKLVEMPSKLDFHCSLDNKFQPIIKNEPIEPIEESDMIVISDDDCSHGNLTAQDPPEDKPKDFLGRWNAKLDRLAAQPLTAADGNESKESQSSNDALLLSASSLSPLRSYAKLKRRTARYGIDANGNKIKGESRNSAQCRSSKSLSPSTSTHTIAKPKSPMVQPVADESDKSNDSRSSDDVQRHSSKFHSQSRSTQTETLMGLEGEADDGESNDCRSSNGALLHLSKYRSRSTDRTEKPKRLVVQPVADADGDKSNDCRSSNDVQHHSSRSRSSSKSGEEPASEKPIDIVDEVKSPEDEADEDNKKFLMWFLPEMRTMTETQNYEFRLEVMQALSRAKYS